MSDIPPRAPDDPRPAPIEGGLTAEERARLAGWDPADGPAPYEHSAPPAADPALGHNGVPLDPNATVVSSFEDHQ